METSALEVPGAGAIDARALSKLRWRCRRGLLENDLLIERYLARNEAISADAARGLGLLMQLPAPDLLDLFLGRRAPPPELAGPEVLRVLHAVRPPR
jgi:antitoxin CptB